MKMQLVATLTGVTVLMASQQQCLTADVVLGISSQADKTKTVYWNSEPGAIYRIQSAEDLNPVHPNFPARWVVREAEFPSQGTTTMWMDTGDANWIPRIFHPILDDYRFYTVLKMGTATLASPTVTISLFQGGNAIPPEQTMVDSNIEVRWNVDLGTSGDLLSEVLIMVDGQVLTRGADVAGSLRVNTTEWPNGQHRILAVAKTFESADTTPLTGDASTTASDIGIGVSSARTISFDNYISQFFVATPYFQPAVHGVQEIIATFKQNSCWTLTVLTGQGVPVRAYQGEGAFLYVAWDGNNASGTEVPDGVYDYLIEAMPCSGEIAQTTSATTTIEAPPSPSASALAERTVSFQAAKLPGDMTFPKSRAVDPRDRNPRSLKPPEPVTATNSDAGLEALQMIPPPLRTNLQLVLSLSNSIASVMQRQKEMEEQREATASSTETTQLDGLDAGQTTSTPMRAPGAMFKGFAGVYGTGYQGHHPSWQDVGFFSMPSGTSGPSSRWAPYGKLRNAAAIASNFGTGLTGWRRAFDLADTPFRWWHITGCWTSDCDNRHNPEIIFPGYFATVDLGLITGHMISVESSPFAAQHSYTPLWNPDEWLPGGGTWRSYNWVAMPEMDFGQSGSVFGLMPLKWMALYGCNSLRVLDINDLWTKFLLPFPPNMHILLGADTSVWIHPAMGTAFAFNLTGGGNRANAQTIINAWFNAGTSAHIGASRTRNPLKRPGTVIMTAVYRLSFDEPGTYNDTLYSYSNFIGTDWELIDWEPRTIYQP